ncbi:hypothetical protein DB347_22715 [Opitutaceae bacterium EW11]|nr:hypothetical protein DB347_22715 [Opitutaceae bacterium EW11]
MQALLHAVGPGETLVIDYSSAGCFHQTHHTLTIDASDDARANVRVETAQRPAEAQKDSSKAESVIVPLTHNDVKRLHALFACYDSKKPDMVCTTVDTIRFSRRANGKVVSSVEVTDSSCSVSDRIDLLSVSEIIERAELARRLPNQSLEPTATAVTPRAGARVAPAVTVAHH